MHDHVPPLLIFIYSCEFLSIVHHCIVYHVNFPHPYYKLCDHEYYNNYYCCLYDKPKLINCCCLDKADLAG